MFVDREQELASLETTYRRLNKSAGFVVIYGRRRVGKTELIKRFLNGKEHIYLLATLQSEKDVVKKFSMRSARYFKDDATLKNPHTDWDSFFEYLARELRRSGKNIVLVFDEFTYLVQQNRAITSILQYYWDEYLKTLPVMLILCGSYVGMMEKEVLAYNSPLYGRRTGQVYLDRMGFKYLKEFLKEYDIEELVEAYAIAGGIPFYLQQLDSRKDIISNIKENFLRKDRPLFQDALFMLRDELKEPRNYLSILKAVSFGKTRPKEISDFAGLDPLLVGKYLDVLKGMKIVKRVVPVTAKKSQRGIYKVSDNYFNFWLRFVYPNEDNIEMGMEEAVVGSIKKGFNAYVGERFEDLAREFLVEMNRLGRLPFVFSKIGRWWHKGQEIDLVAMGSKGEYLAIEVKWKKMNKMDIERTIRSLQEKAQKFKDCYFVIIAREIDKRDLEVPEKTLFFDLADFEDIFH